MNHKDINNAASAIMAIHLETMSIATENVNPLQALANIKHICDTVCPLLNLPSYELENQP